MATQKERKPIYISNDLYDALHLSALAFGGVGGGDYFDHEDRDECGQSAPFCISGHAQHASDGRFRASYLIERNDEVTSPYRRSRWDTYVRKMNLHPMREKPARVA